MEATESLIKQIVGGFVKNPNDIHLHIEDITDDEGELIIINIKVNAEDVGVCIGEKGSTADALRRIVGLVGFRQTGKRVFLRIDAPKIPRNYFY